MKLLVKSGINVNAKNSEGLTALDMLDHNSKQVEEILLHGRALKAYSLPSQVTMTDSYHHLKYSRLSFKERRVIWMTRLNNKTNNDTRGVILVVAALIVTATYQSALSPPGGLWQETSSANNATTEFHRAGKAIMVTGQFFYFYFLNSLTLLATSLVIFVLLPSDQISWLIFLPLYLFSLCYVLCWVIISPGLASVFVIVIWFSIYTVGCIWLRLYKNLPKLKIKIAHK